jgi:hypothetical protein
MGCFVAGSIGDKMSKRTTSSQDAEIAAMSTVFEALKDLASDAQLRVLRYAMQRLGLRGESQWEEERGESRGGMERLAEPHARVHIEERPSLTAPPTDSEEGLQEGLSPVALKWIRRNDLTTAKLSSLFSIGVDEIDLVARRVPGSSKSQKFRNVALLKGVASYLGTGSAKVYHKALKEAAGHYGADPGNNITTYIKNMSADMTGTAASGYTLTTHGLTEARDLIVDMTTDKKPETK